MSPAETIPPSADELARSLGRSAALWNELRTRVAEAHAPLTETWKFYKQWTLQLRRKKRTVLWMSPGKKRFLVATAYGEKAAAAALRSDLADEVKKSIEDAPRYAEGRAVRITVRYRRDVENVLKVAAIKMAT